jgi:hypothetical protein
MAKPQPKPAKPEADTEAPPDLVLVDKAPPQPKAEVKAGEAAAPKDSKTRARRNLHPARVWPD